MYGFDFDTRMIYYVGADGVLRFYSLDHPDQSTFVPDDALLRQVPALFGQDTAARDQAVAAFGQHQQQAGQQQPAGRGDTGTRGLRDTPEQINTYTQMVQNFRDVRQATDALDQAEHAMRQEMAAAGNDPSYWFAQAPQPQPGQGQPGAPAPTPQESAFPGRMPTDYQQAYDNNRTEAARLALLARAEQLQSVRNLWDAHREGAGRLQNYREALQTQNDIDQQLADQEAQDTRDPRQDKAFTQYTDAQGVTHSVHAGNLALARRGEAARRAASEAEFALSPDVAIANRRAQLQQRAAQPGARPGDVNYTWLDPELDPLRRQYGTASVPAYAEGGEANPPEQFSPAAYGQQQMAAQRFEAAMANIQQEKAAYTAAHNRRMAMLQQQMAAIRTQNALPPAPEQVAMVG